MSVRQTQPERCLSGLIILFLLAIGTITRCNAQYDYPDLSPDATLEFPEPEGAEQPTIPEVISETDSEPGTVPETLPETLPETVPETVPEIEDELETESPSFEEDKPEEEKPVPEDTVEATPGEDPESEAPVKPDIAEIEATAQAEPESDDPAETPVKPDATAPAEKLELTGEITEPAAEVYTQPEPDAQPTTGPKEKKKKKKSKKKSDKKKKKKKKKKTPGKEKSPDPTTESKPIEPEPIEPEETEPEPQPVEPKPIEPKPIVPIEPTESEIIVPYVPKPVEPEPVKPEPVKPEPKPEEPEPIEPKPVEPEPKPVKPEVPEPVKPKPEKVPEVVEKPVEPVTQGPCIDIYTTAQKRQACTGEWKDAVYILNLQVDKLAKEKQKLWMQVTEIFGQIAFSRRTISELQLATNAWKKRVAFPYAASDEEIKEDIKDCNDALGKGHEKPGVYLLNPDGSPYNVRALCVNGWTVVQRRFDGSEDFNRDFDGYVSGFGNFSGEFFLGLENLHRMALNKGYTLRIDAKGTSGKWYYGVYDDFSLSDETDQYRLILGNMSAGNYFDGFENSRDEQFSTRDRDNDKWRGGNCAEHYGGGWWSSTCNTNLNQMWCRNGCLRWASKRVVTSMIRIKPTSAIVEDDLAENPNPAGLTLEETPA